MLETISHIVPNLVCKKKAVVGIDLVVDRSRVLELELLIPLSHSRRTFPFERVDPCHVEINPGQIERYCLVLYVLTMVHTGRQVKGRTCPCFRVAYARLPLGCHMFGDVVTVVFVESARAHAHISRKP